MGILFKSYESSGPGIAKDTPKKKGIALFFDILFRKFWLIGGVNLLYYIFILPLTFAFAAITFIKNETALIIVLAAMLLIFAVTIGPATAGMTRVIRSFVIQKHTFIFRDFFRAFKANFKKASLIGILDVLVYISSAASLYVYPQMVLQFGTKAFYIPMVITLSLSLVVTMMNFYIWLMLVATDLSFKDLIKNSFALAFVAMKTNLLTFVITIIITFLMLLLLNYATPMFMMLIPFIPAAIMCFIICFNCYPIIQKYVINPYYASKGETNPELINDAEAVDEETIFEDMGGKEKPIDKEKKSKGKRIS